MSQFTNALQYIGANLPFVSPEIKAELEQMIAFVKTNGTVLNPMRKLKKLALRATVAVEATISFVVRDFFKMGDNGQTKIWMSDAFKEKVLAFASSTASSSEVRLDKLELTESMNDSQITVELGSPTPFSIDGFLSHTKGLILKQPKGEKGDLLTNGYANIFYVTGNDGRTFAVDVHWNGRQWEFDCREFVEDGWWRAGRCVFSPALVNA